MYKYDYHCKISSKVFDEIKTMLLSKLPNNSRLLALPVELASQIFIYAQNPALATTCAYFWQLSQFPVTRARYLLYRYGPIAVLGETAMKRKIVTLQVVHYLLQSEGVDPTANGDYWLYTQACESNQWQVCEWVIEATSQDPSILSHLLHLAALKGSIPIVDLLIQKYHVNMVHTNGEQMVLTIACRENRVELVEHLVKTYGCNIHVNHEKHLRNACLYGYHDLVHFLLSLDVDVHAYHDAAIQNAAYKGFSSIVKMLLDAGAYADANQNACIQYAITNNDLETVQHLIQAGVHPRSDNDWPLRHACRRGLDAIVLYLLDCIGEHGPNVQEGMPLEEALMHGHVSIVRILLDRGANPNSRKAIRGLRYIVNPKSKTLNKDTMISMLTNAGLKRSCEPLLSTMPHSKGNLLSTILSWI